MIYFHKYNNFLLRIGVTQDVSAGFESKVIEFIRRVKASDCGRSMDREFQGKQNGSKESSSTSWFWTIYFTLEASSGHNEQTHTTTG